MADQAKVVRTDAKKSFNPDSLALRKADILDYIHTNYPHAIIPSKSRLADVRRIAKELIASDLSSSELTSSPDSEVQSPEPPMSNRNSESKDPLPQTSTPPKYHKKTFTSPSTRGRSKKKPYARPSTPSKSYKNSEISPSPVQNRPSTKSYQCPTTPSKSLNKSEPSTLHKKCPNPISKRGMVSHNPPKDPKKRTKSAVCSRFPSSSRSTHSKSKSTSKYNKCKENYSRKIIPKKATLERSPPSSESDSEESHSSHISIPSEETEDSSGSQPSQEFSSDSDGTSGSSCSTEADQSSAPPASVSRSKSFKKKREWSQLQKTQLQKSKKKQNNASHSRRVTFAKSPPPKSAKKILKYSQSRRANDPLDDIENATQSIDYRQVRLDPYAYGPSTDIDMEVLNRSKRSSSGSKSRRNRVADNLTNMQSMDMNESFFTPASLSYYSDNPYPPHNPTSYLNSYPHPNSTKAVSDPVQNHQTTSHFNYSPVAFYNPMNPGGRSQASSSTPASYAPTYRLAERRSPSSSTSPWNSQPLVQDVRNNPLLEANSHYSNVTYIGSTPRANNNHQPFQRGSGPNDKILSSNVSSLSMPTPNFPPAIPSPHHQPENYNHMSSANSNHNRYQHEHVPHTPSSAPFPFNNPYHQASQPSYFQNNASSSFSSRATPIEPLAPPPKATSFSSQNTYHPSNAYHHALPTTTTAEHIPPPPKSTRFKTGILGQPPISHSPFPSHKNMGPTPNQTTSPLSSTLHGVIIQGSNPTQQAPPTTNSYNLHHNVNQSAICGSNPNPPSSLALDSSHGFNFAFPLSNASEARPEAPPLRSSLVDEKSKTINDEHEKRGPFTGAQHRHNPPDGIPTLSLTFPTPPSIVTQSSGTLSEKADYSASDHLKVPTVHASNRNRCVKEIPKFRAFSSCPNIYENSTTASDSSNCLKTPPDTASQPSKPISHTVTELQTLGGYSQDQFDELARGLLAQFLAKDSTNLNGTDDRAGFEGAATDLLRVHGTNLNIKRQQTSQPEKDKSARTPSNESQETKKSGVEPSSQESHVQQPLSQSSTSEDSRATLLSVQKPEPPSAHPLIQQFEPSSTSKEEETQKSPIADIEKPDLECIV